MKHRHEQFMNAKLVVETFNYSSMNSIVFIIKESLASYAHDLVGTLLKVSFLIRKYETKDRYTLIEPFIYEGESYAKYASQESMCMEEASTQYNVFKQTMKYGQFVPRLHLTGTVNRPLMWLENFVARDTLTKEALLYLKRRFMEDKYIAGYIVMQRMEGYVSFVNVPIKERHSIYVNCMAIFILIYVKTRILHMDPHSSNILVNTDNEEFRSSIIILDFGSVIQDGILLQPPEITTPDDVFDVVRYYYIKSGQVHGRGLQWIIEYLFPDISSQIVKKTPDLQPYMYTLTDVLAELNRLQTPDDDRVVARESPVFLQQQGIKLKGSDAEFVSEQASYLNKPDPLNGTDSLYDRMKLEEQRPTVLEFIHGVLDKHSGKFMAACAVGVGLYLASGRTRKKRRKKRTRKH